MLRATVAKNKESGGRRMPTTKTNSQELRARLTHALTIQDATYILGFPSIDAARSAQVADPSFFKAHGSLLTILDPQKVQRHHEGVLTTFVHVVDAARAVLVERLDEAAEPDGARLRADV